MALHQPLPIEQQIVASIRKIVRAVDLHSRRLVENFGLTGPQLATLQEIARLEKASPSVIARAVHLSQGTVTGILHRLESRGFIERMKSDVDRRSIEVHITAEGMRTLDAAPSLMQDSFRLQLERLEEWERHQILATLQRIASLMGAERLDAAPHLISSSMNDSVQTGSEMKTSGDRRATGHSAPRGLDASS